MWSEGECRLGLKPTARRVWCLRGVRPTCSGRHRFEWLYVSGFARPSAGQVLSVIRPRINALLMGQALAELARQAAPGGEKLLVLLIDNAPWHAGEPVRQVLAEHPELELKRLPSYSPQLNPIERAWKVLRRRATHNRPFDTLADLRSSLSYFQTMRERARSLVNRQPRKRTTSAGS